MSTKIDVVNERMSEGMISCSEFDYSGNKLAVCCSDSMIKLYEYRESSISIITTLENHIGEVLSLSWSHPKFGCLLASSGSDQRLLIWREQSPKHYIVTFEHTDSCSINCVSWAPWELGLKLLAGLDDGSVIIFSYTDQWETSHRFSAHACSVKAIAWGSVLSLVSSSSFEKNFRFLTGAVDGKINYWTLDEGIFNQETLEKHKGPIRSISWNPVISANRELFASCDEHSYTVWYWNTEEVKWNHKDFLEKNNISFWKVSWNPQGNALAVSVSDNSTWILRENFEEKWKPSIQISQKGEIIDKNENS